MPGGRDDDQRIAQEARRHHRLLGRRLGHDVEIVDVSGQTLEDRLAVLHDERDLDRRPRPAELAEQARDEGFRRADHGQPELAALVAAQLGERRVEVLQFLLEARRRGDQRLAGRGQVQAATDHLVEGQAGLFGQLAQLGGERRLGEVEGARGARDAAFTGDGKEQAQLVQGEMHYLYK